jgi:hypothetical protein
MTDMEAYPDHIKANPATVTGVAAKAGRRAVHKAAWRDEHISLCETLDRVLNKGVVVVGEVVISVANVDLLYIGLNLMVTSVETVNQMRAEQNARETQ